jgi:RNAse (barnase) inhibitor barstar
MAVVRLNTKQITDWASFHQVCKEAFGFPEFYGANMNAWIDCLSYLMENDGMTRFVLLKDEILNIKITDSENFKSRLPEIFEALVECITFVNNRYIEPKILLILL